MTRRRRLRRRLLWAGVLLSLALLLATVSVLRVVIWTGQRMTSHTRPTRMENAMFRRRSLAVVAALGVLLLAAPASADNWGADRLHAERSQTPTPDAPGRRGYAQIEQLRQADASGWFERFAAAHSLRAPVVDDRFRIDPTDTATPVVVTSGRELEWPQTGVALAFGLLLGLGLVLAVRITDSRHPVAR